MNAKIGIQGLPSPGRLLRKRKREGKRIGRQERERGGERGRGERTEEGKKGEK